MSTGRNHWIIGIAAVALIIGGSGIGCASDNATYPTDNKVASTSASFSTPAENTTAKPSATKPKPKPKPKPSENSTTPKPPSPGPAPVAIDTFIPSPDPTLTGLFANQPPVINKIIFNNGTPVTITPDMAVPVFECNNWTSCNITCLASDPNRDKLSYTWMASEGRILGQGKECIWTAPGMSGLYKITVTVRDVKDGLANLSMMVKVTYSGK